MTCPVFRADHYFSIILGNFHTLFLPQSNLEGVCHQSKTHHNCEGVVTCAYPKDPTINSELARTEVSFCVRLLNPLNVRRCGYILTEVVYMHRLLLWEITGCLFLQLPSRDLLLLYKTVLSPTQYLREGVVMLAAQLPARSLASLDLVRW